MDKVLTEGDLQFDFSKAICAQRFDDEAKHRLSHCLKRVDFLVEWDQYFWLVEVKDPSSEQIPQKFQEKTREAFIDQLNSETLFSKNLAPKAKDSFLYLYLSDELPPKPVLYLVFIGLNDLDDGMVSTASDNLARYCCLSGPDGNGWRNPYFEGAAVFNERTWNRHMPTCPVTRK